MKKYIINFFLLSAVLFVGCKKNNDRYPFNVALARVPYVNVIADATGSAAIDVLNLGVFSGKFNTTLLYPNDAPPSKIDIVIIKNGDNSTVKVLQAGVTTFPSTTFTVTAAQIASLFGATIKLGDNYDIGADIYTQDGTKYQAFPTAGVNLLAYSGTGQANQPGFVPTTRFSAICAYDPTIYQGNFIITKDLWGDTQPNQIVVLTKVDNTHFSFIYNPYPQLPTGTLFNAVPIIVTVNTLNNTPSVTSQIAGSGWTYDNSKAVTVTTSTSANNNLAPCNQTVSLNLTWTQGSGTYSGYVLQLKKQ